MRTLLILLIFIFSTAASAVGPNFVFILGDDVDDMNVGSYNATYGWGTAGPTPNIDTLATNGVRFDRFAAEPMCSPARVSLLTGRHPFRHGVGRALSLDGANDNFRGLDPNEKNIAQMLRANGYYTALIGKAHFAGGSYLPDLQYWVNRAGFEYFAGTMMGEMTNTVIPGGSPPNGFGNYSDHEWIENGVGSESLIYHTTKVFDTAITQLVAARASGKPFFLWVAPNAPHFPYHCPPNALTPTYDAVCTPSGSDTQDQAYYKAMLEAADTEMARLFAHASWSWADTTVFYIGDNGFPINLGDLSPFDDVRCKQSAYGCGVRTPLIVRGQAVQGSEVGTVGTQSIHVADVAATVLDLAGLGEAVANGTAGVTDGISFKAYLTESSTASLRTVSFAQGFAPTGLPYLPTVVHERTQETGAFRIVHHLAGTEELYDTSTDILCDSRTSGGCPDLLLGALTTPQQNAYDKISPMQDDLQKTPRSAPRILRDSP